MNCDKCHGKGWVDDPDIMSSARLPCEECGGNGKSHCCDGLKEQPEKPE